MNLYLPVHTLSLISILEFGLVEIEKMLLFIIFVDVYFDFDILDIEEKVDVPFYSKF